MANVVQITLRGVDELSRAFTRPVRTMRDLERTIKRVTFAATGMAAGLGAALTAITIRAINNADEMGKLAQVVGFENVQAFSRLAFAADSLGISTSDLRVGINTLNRSIAEAANNIESRQARAFESLGISVRNANGQLKTNEEVLLEVSDAFARFDDGANKSALALLLLGESGARMLPLLNRGRDGIEELGSASVGVNEELATAAAELKENVDVLVQSVSNFGLSLANELTPGLVGVTNAMIGMQGDARNTTVIAAQAAAVIKDMAGGAAILAKWMSQLGIIMRTVGLILFDFIVTPLRNAFAVIRSVVEGLRQLIEFWTEFISIVASAGDVFAFLFEGEFRKASDAAKGVLTDLKEHAVESGQEYLQFWKDLAGDIAENVVRPFSTAQTEIERMNKDLEATNRLVRDFIQGLFGGPSSVELPDVTGLPEAGERGQAPAPPTGGAAKERTETLRQELETQAGMIRAFEEGNVQAFIEARQTEAGASLAWLDSQQNVIRTWNQLWQNSLLNTRAAFSTFLSDVTLAFSDAFGSAIAAIATGAKTASEAFKQLGQQMLGLIVKIAAQMAINAALALAFQSTITGAALGAASTLIASWTAAATAASIATLGGATSAAAAVIPAMAANVAAAKGLAVVGGAAGGGLDFVPDNQTFLVHRGERIVQPEANRDLTQFLRGVRRQGGGGGPTMVEINLDGETLARGIGRMSEDGRLQINARSVI